MEATLRHARALGAGYVYLATGEDDTGARALYERLGFSNGGRFYERELATGPPGAARGPSAL